VYRAVLSADMAENATSRKTTILLADDHREFSATVAGMLRNDFEIVGTVNDGEQLVKASMKLVPDVVIVDISMPVLNGIEAAEQLSRLGNTAKVIFLTIHADADFVRACLDAGAAGYVVKSQVAMDLVPAIRQALAGKIFVSHDASLDN